MSDYHEPVMLVESVENLVFDSSGKYVDLTFGGGGHSSKILEELNDAGRLFSFDQDEDAILNCGIEDDRFRLFKSNFRFFDRVLRMEGVRKVDGVFADLGVSSHQFDVPERGFSYRFDAKLDMRMSAEGDLTAEYVLNNYGATELQNMFGEYGEVRNAKTLALCILERRRLSPFVGVQDFVQAISPVIKGDRMRYLAQVFQALRIEVNDEMGALKEMLEKCLLMLNPGGRLVVLTYHSLEDRLVKRFMKNGHFDTGHRKDDFGNITRYFKDLVGGVVLPTAEEIKRNSRARSAKLRVVERI